MSDSRMYPEGRGQTVTKYIQGVEVIFGSAKTLRTRVSIAQINAGFALLPALPGVRWRLTDAYMIAVGGAAGAATTVDITGTQAASSAKLLAVAIAALTQSAIVRAGAANATLLADGASFAQCDANAAVNASKTGASLTTCTFVDYFMEYIADPA